MQRKRHLPLLRDGNEGPCPSPNYKRLPYCTGVIPNTNSAQDARARHAAYSHDTLYGNTDSECCGRVGHLQDVSEHALGALGDGVRDAKSKARAKPVKVATADGEGWSRPKILAAAGAAAAAAAAVGCREKRQAAAITWGRRRVGSSVRVRTAAKVNGVRSEASKMMKGQQDEEKEAGKCQLFCSPPEGGDIDKDNRCDSSVRPSLLAIVLQGLKELKIPLKTNFNNPHSLCLARFTSVEIARRTEIQAVERAVEHRHAHSGESDRGSAPVLSVCAASGMGKSRFLDLLANHVLSIERDSTSSLLGSVVLAVSYNCVTGTPSNTDLETGISAVSGLAARILWSYFVELEHGVQSQYFVEFCSYLQDAVGSQDLNPVQAIEAVMQHQGKRSILLLVDDLMHLDQLAAADWSFQVLSEIGIILDKISDFNCVVSLLKPGPVLRMLLSSGRPVKWISLPPFTLQESLAALKPTLDKHSHFRMDKIMRLCVSEVGGHVRGLEVLQAALDKHLVQDMLYRDIFKAVVGEFRAFYASMRPLTETMVKTALKGELVELTDTLDGLTVEQLIADGVFLNSQVLIATAFVPRLSVTRLRVFVDTEVVHQATEYNLVNCIKETALSLNTEFDLDDKMLFHAKWEVLTRFVGWTGQMTLAKFYNRGEELAMPNAAKNVVIDFCEKTIGVVDWMDSQSVFNKLSPNLSCQVVYMARKEAGFDLVMIESKVGGGHVVIFVDTKYPKPGSKKVLGPDEPQKKNGQMPRVV